MTETSGSGGHVEAFSISVNDVVHNKSFELCSENFDEELLDFELPDEENFLLSYFPSELDFYDSKRGNILRRSGGKKLLGSLKAKGTKNGLWDGQPVPTSSKHGGRAVCSANKEMRIKEMRIVNSQRKKESKAKPKSEFEIIQKRQAVRADRKAKIPDPRPIKEKTKESIDQTTKPPTFYNNSDFVLGSGDSVKFDDQAFVNLLIELQNRDITPEDYDLLVQLDLLVKPKTLSQAQIDSLRSDIVRNMLDDVCSICMEDYTFGEERKFLPCKHFFHSKCIQTWLSWTSNKCPIDGKEVS